MHLLNKYTASDAVSFRKIFIFFSPASSVIPLFILKWLNQIFPLHLASFLSYQTGSQFLANSKTCQGNISCMEERSFCKKWDATHIELEETPGIFRQLKPVSLSVCTTGKRFLLCNQATRWLQGRQHHPQQSYFPLKWKTIMFLNILWEALYSRLHWRICFL